MSESIIRELASNVAEIVAYSNWIVFGRPCWHGAALHIVPRHDEFVASDIEHPSYRITADRIGELLQAFQLPLLEQLDPAQFDFPVDDHFGSVWTDDDPWFRIQVRLKNGEVLSATSQSQHAFMVPWQLDHLMTLSARAPTKHSAGCRTYDICLSRAIAAVLPEEFLNAHRLRGEGCMIGREEPVENQAVDEPLEWRDSESPFDEGDEKRPANEEVLAAADESEISFDFLNDDQELPALESLPKAFEELEAALMAGANASACDKSGQTALMYASWSRNREKFRLLVAHGGNVNARRNDGMTGLHLAAAGGEPESVQEWIEAGAEIELRSPEGSTALMLGAGWVKVVESLLSAGADPNVQDHDGDTAGVYAIQYDLNRGTAKCVVLTALLKAGLDPAIPNKKGETLIDHVRRRERRELLEERISEAQRQEDPSTWQPWRPLRTGWSELARLVSTPTWGRQIIARFRKLVESRGKRPSPSFAQTFLVMVPQGPPVDIKVRWTHADLTVIEEGDSIAVLGYGMLKGLGALHEIDRYDWDEKTLLAPAKGRVRHTVAEGAIVGPGDMIGSIEFSR